MLTDLQIFGQNNRYNRDALAMRAMPVVLLTASSVFAASGTEMYRLQDVLAKRLRRLSRWKWRS
jgi:hypothetical protein